MSSFYNLKSAAQVAVIERSRTRHIVNLPDLIAACDAAPEMNQRKISCAALSFDGVEDFPGLLRKLQTVDVLVIIHSIQLFAVRLTV